VLVYSLLESGEFPEMLYKHLFDIADLDEGNKDRVPSGLRGLQRRQRPHD
jgi:hypothetical protein